VRNNINSDASSSPTWLDGDTCRVSWVVVPVEQASFPLYQRPTLAYYTSTSSCKSDQHSLNSAPMDENMKIYSTKWYDRAGIKHDGIKLGC